MKKFTKEQANLLMFEKNRIENDFFFNYFLKDIEDLYKDTKTPYPTEEDLKVIKEREEKIIKKLKSNFYDFYKMETAKRKTGKIFFEAEEITETEDIEGQGKGIYILSSYRGLKEVDLSDVKIENGKILFKRKNERKYRFSYSLEDNRFLYNVKNKHLFIIK